MIRLPGILFQRIAAGGKRPDLRIHLFDLTAVLVHQPFLPPTLQAGADPVQDAAVRKEQQPKGHQRRYDEDERKEVVMVAAGQEAALVLLVCHIPGEDFRVFREISKFA